MYTALGSSSLKVSKICFGAYVFGRAKGYRSYNWPNQLDEKNDHEILDRYVELEGIFIDTASVYSNGLSEIVIGTWLQRQDRSKLVILTKVGVYEENKQADLITFLGCWCSTVKNMAALKELMECQKIRHYSVSNVCGWQMQKIVHNARALDMQNPVCLGQQYNIIHRNGELEEFAVCKMEGISIVPWGAILGGVLTDKYKRGVVPKPDSGRVGYIHQHENQAIESAPAWSKFAEDEHYWKLREVMETIAKKHGASVAQVAIRWLMQKDVVSSVAVSATSLKQLEDNMAATTWSLTEEEDGILRH